jgi:CHAT domain-containing protein/tetratricopeptide (TPR) repeat protein
MPEARRHLDGCELCQGLLQTHEALRRWVGEIGEARLGPSCPSEDEWWRVAASLLPESRTAELLEHSIQCDACGLLLRQAVQDFAEEATEEDTTELGALPSVQKERQRSFAQRLSAAQSERERSADDGTHLGGWFRGLAERFAWQPRGRLGYIWAYASAAVVLVVGVWIIQKPREPSIDQLIASAYAQQRPFELRVSDAAYGPLRQERAGERSSFSQPTDLLQAKYLIKEKLTSRPDDETLLAARGRIELFEGHYEEAIRTLGRLLDAKPDSPALLIDLATAHFQRAEAGNRAIDYGQAVELLSRALAKKPDDRVALFNRAIALEKMYVYNEAIRDWEQYLRVDPDSEWAGEARWRLNKLQEQMKAREKPAALLKSDPAAAAHLLRARAEGRWTNPTPWATSLDEEYLDLTVREWLPALYVSFDSRSQKRWRREPAVWDALTAIADVLRIHHKDRWLDDLLRGLPVGSAAPGVVRQFAEALGALAGASKANAAGDPDTAYPLAEAAARSFRVAGSTAGFLRAREEIIYSLLRARRIQECIQVTGQQLGETTLDSYVWLKGQAILWNATCWGAEGNPGLAQRLSERALELTKNADYANQYIRSALFTSGFYFSTGNWQQIRAGLQKYWADLHNPFHGYEFYDELGYLAEDAQKRHLARLLRREALGMIERTPELLFQAVAHYRLAISAKNVQDLPEAETELRIASQQFAALHKSPTSQLYRMASEVELAGVEIQQGRLDSAAVRLELASLNLTDMSDTATTFNYYGTLGQLHLRGGNLPKAEQALWSAVRVGEVHLSSLHSDTDRLAWERDTAAVHRALVELYVQRGDTTTRALEVWERYRASPSRKSASPPSPREHGTWDANARPGSRPLSLVKDTLPILNHETVVSFAVLPSGVAAWAFDDRGVNFTWVAITEDELTRRVNHFAYLCSDPSSDLTKLWQEGQNLHDLLLGPFEPHLEPTRLLVIEPDSVLSMVPWPAIVDSRGKYLGSQFAIVVSPGLSYWRNLRSPAAISSEQRALVVGMPALAPAVGARFSSLPDAGSEAQDIAARFRDSHLLSGREVSAAAIRQELLRSKVFHFAGHAVSGANESGLLLASPDDLDGNSYEPTLLSVSQLDQAVLQQLQLVVLSACATAETEKGFTEAETLVPGFLRAGVPHVVASRWPVDSYTTKQTMNEFYAALFDGLTPARALQQAANRLRLAPATTHPFYWAAFGVYGR